MGRDAGLIERGKIAFVDEGVMNVFRQWIEVGDFGESLIVCRASVFGKVVAWEEDGGFRFCERFNEVGKEDVFCESWVMNDPEVCLL